MRLHVAQERGGARAGAFPVVERLRLALRARAGASLCSCVWAGGKVTGSAVNGSERHLCQSRTRDANVPIQLCTERAGGASTVGRVCATSASAWTLGWEAVSDRRGSLCSGLIITVYLTIMPHNYAFSTLLGCCVCSKWFQALDKNTDLVNVVTCDCGLSMTRHNLQIWKKNSSQVRASARVCVLERAVMQPHWPWSQTQIINSILLQKTAKTPQKL